jgi:adsorption protein B
MPAAEFLTRVAAELALFAGVGFLLFGLNDLAVDIVYFTRRFWRRHTVYKRHRRAFASYYVLNKNPGFIAILVPAWDESAVVAQMLRSTLKRLDYPDYRIFVGHYRNDPATAAATAAAIAGVPTTGWRPLASKRTGLRPRRTASTIFTTP